MCVCVCVFCTFYLCFLFVGACVLTCQVTWPHSAVPVYFVLPVCVGLWGFVSIFIVFKRHLSALIHLFSTVHFIYV